MEKFGNFWKGSTPVYKIKEKYQTLYFLMFTPTLISKYKKEVLITTESGSTAGWLTMSQFESLRTFLITIFYNGHLLNIKEKCDSSL